jgi:hypothetical protein
MSVAMHFTGKDPAVRATYQRLIDVARTFGPVTEDAKKTSIHLMRHAALVDRQLAGWLKAAYELASPRS